MMMNVAKFETDTLIPAFEEICASPALNTDWAPEIVKARPHGNPAVEELLTALAGAFKGKTTGASLVIAKRARDASWPATAGYYVMTAMYVGRQFVSPALIYWMQFNERAHAFDHRYDPTRAQIPLRDITRADVLNHVLESFDFYKLHAFSTEPFPGYRGR